MLKYIAFVSLLVLAGCETPNFNSGFQPTPTKWTYMPVKYDVQYFQKDVDARCFAYHGVPLKDRTGCVLVSNRTCTYITLPNDDHAMNELNAICNGYRPGLL